MNSRRGFFHKIAGGAAIALTSRAALAVPSIKPATFYRYFPEGRAWLAGPDGVQFAAVSKRVLKDRVIAQFTFEHVSARRLDRLIFEFTSSPTAHQVFTAAEVIGLPLNNVHDAGVVVTLNLRFDS